ncbi:MAG: Hsp20/alpha crystallin family protein [Bacillota bacterium]
MTVLRFEPMKELENLNNKIQRYFEDFPTFGLESGGNFNPRFDISEDDKSLFIEAEIPGTKKEDLKITLHDNILTLKGEKRKEEERKDRNYFRSERIYGIFTRSFTLPVQVDSNNVDAKFEDGILRIRMEKVHPKPVNEKEIKLS